VVAGQGIEQAIDSLKTFNFALSEGIATGALRADSSVASTSASTIDCLQIAGSPAGQMDDLFRMIGTAMGGLAPRERWA
jgi:hypothetical protein